MRLCPDNWGPIESAPFHVLTSDQDWAPEWAMERFFELTSELGAPVHLFRTNPSSVIDEHAPDFLTQGWHPNFQIGSTHGATTSEVIKTLGDLVPGATTVRSHVFHESTSLWNALFSAGIRVDSQTPTVFQNRLVPLLHSSGILRLPVFLEDDLWMELMPNSTDISQIRTALHGPGLKILNFHPIHVALNSPSMAYYRQHAASGWNAPYRGHGMADLLRDVLTEITRISALHGFVTVADDLRGRIVDAAWANRVPGSCRQTRRDPHRHVGHARLP